MTDIRDKVAGDRGLLKRIQLYIPGFSGYRIREDIRQADSILRLQLANKLKDIRGNVEKVRQKLIDNYQMKALEPIGKVIFESQELEGLIRHAEQGYSGISWAIKIDISDLNRLYEHDLTLLDGLKALEDKVNSMQNSTENIIQISKDCSNSISEIKNTFKNRLNVITQTEVK